MVGVYGTEIPWLCDMSQQSGKKGRKVNYVHLGHIDINVRFLANLQEQNTLYLFISGIEIHKSVPIYAEENLTLYIYIYRQTSHTQQLQWSFGK